MRAGRLIHEIQLQVFTQVKGAEGGITKTWTNYGPPMPASIKDLRGTVQAVASEGGKAANVSTEITMRYLEGVRPQMRVIHGSDIYTIQFANDWERRREKLILSCITGVASA